jgi:hypothetical protein
MRNEARSALTHTARERGDWRENQNTETPFIGEAFRDEADGKNVSGDLDLYLRPELLQVLQRFLLPGYC